MSCDVPNTRPEPALSQHRGGRTPACFWGRHTFQVEAGCLPDTHFTIDTLGGTEQEERKSGLGGPQIQAGKGNCHPTARRWAVAERPSQEKLQPTYQHPRRLADDAAPLPSLPGSLPSPQAQSVLTFKAKCVSTILNNIPSCGLLSVGEIDHSN